MKQQGQDKQFLAFLTPQASVGLIPYTQHAQNLMNKEFHPINIKLFPELSHPVCSMSK